MTRIEQIWHKISFYNVTLEQPLPAWDHADCKSASSLSCKNQCFFKELKPANIFSQSLSNEFAKTPQNLHLHCTYHMLDMDAVGEEGGEQKVDHISTHPGHSPPASIYFCVFRMYTEQRFDSVNNFHHILSRCL